jgi:hypothetical protein
MKAKGKREKKKRARGFLNGAMTRAKARAGSDFKRRTPTSVQQLTT